LKLEILYASIAYYMAYKCDLCGKGKMLLKSGRHHRGVAGGKWLNRAPKTLKTKMPNLQPFNGILMGIKGHWRLCTKCLRRAKEVRTELQKKTAVKNIVVKKK